MTLTSVILHNENGEDFELGLRKTDKMSRYLVRTILGLDAEELIPKFYRFGLENGESYHEHVMKPRDIVMRVILNPRYAHNETVSDIRDELYRIISSNRTGIIQLRFRSGGVIKAVIEGMITKFEVSYFTQVPELQMTVHCPDPMFRSMTPIQYDIDELPTGTGPAWVELTDGRSTAPHGLSFKVVFTGSPPHFAIQDQQALENWRFQVTPDGGFVTGDILHFSSEYKKKLVYLERTGDNRHLMDKLTNETVWPLIFPGHNRFRFTQAGVIDWLELSYHSVYWGL